MNNGKNIVIAALVAGFLTSTMFWMNLPNVQNGANGRDGKDAQLGGNNVVPFREMTVGDSTTFNYRLPLRTSTTTVCAIQSPAGTSTIEHFSVQFLVGSTSAKTIALAKGAAPQASTTLFTQMPLAADAQGSFIASTTAITQDNLVIAPLNWVNVHMIGGAGVDSPVGSCTAIFRVL